MLPAPNSTKSEASITPEGVHVAVYVGYAYIGNVQSQFGNRPTIALAFEFPSLAKERQDPLTGQKTVKPTVLWVESKYSFHSLSKLYKIASGLCGKALTDADLQQSNVLQDTIGKTVSVQVGHKTSSQGMKFPEIESVLSLPAEVPAMRATTRFEFSILQPDPQQYKTLKFKLMKDCTKAIEWVNVSHILGPVLSQEEAERNERANRYQQSQGAPTPPPMGGQGFNPNNQTYGYPVLGAPQPQQQPLQQPQYQQQQSQQYQQQYAQPPITGQFQAQGTPQNVPQQPAMQPQYQQLMQYQQQPPIAQFQQQQPAPVGVNTMQQTQSSLGGQDHDDLPF